MKNITKTNNSKERLEDILEYLKISANKFSKEIGHDNNVKIQHIKSGRNEISEEVAQDIENRYPEFNYQWLLKGKGEMLKNFIPETDVSRIERNKKSIEKLHEVQSVPLFDSVATLGLVEVVNGAERGNVLDYISIPNLPKSDGAILVTGDSMYPLLKSGDIVALKIINIADIVFGEMHYVEYWGHDFDTEFKVVKYVKKSEKGDDFVQLVSYNQHHEPKDINIKQLKTVAIVNASIRYNRL